MNDPIKIVIILSGMGGDLDRVERDTYDDEVSAVAKEVIAKWTLAPGDVIKIYEAN